MTTLLCEMNKKRREFMEQGISMLPDEMIREYEGKYFSLLKKGRDESKKTVHKYARKDEMTLLNRMEKYSHNHLLFLHNLSVPFDDNISERNLRKAKNRQKMAGGFRKANGHEMCCSIMTMIETLKKREMGIIENIKKVIYGHTSYILAGAKPVSSTARLNCYGSTTESKFIAFYTCKYRFLWYNIRRG